MSRRPMLSMGPSLTTTRVMVRVKVTEVMVAEEVTVAAEVCSEHVQHIQFDSRQLLPNGCCV